MEQTNPYGTIPLRLIIGLVFIYFGYKKLFTGDLLNFTNSLLNLGFPWPTFFGPLVGICEFAGGILIFIGLLTRYAAIMLSVIMIFAMSLVTIPQGFVPTLFPLVVLVGCISLIVTGAGKISLERALFKKEL